MRREWIGQLRVDKVRPGGRVGLRRGCRRAFSTGIPQPEKSIMRFEAPTTVSAAVKLLAGKAGVARVLAGGTDLLVQMRTDRVAPDLIVDVKRIPGLRTITAKAGAFRIGAAVAGAELGEHKALRKAWPGVVEAANLIGSHQIQS